MTPSFIEELFMKIEERLFNLEKEIGEIRADLAVISDEIMRYRECRNEIEDIKRWWSVGKSIAMVIWGIIVTVLNVIINRLIE